MAIATDRLTPWKPSIVPGAGLLFGAPLPEVPADARGLARAAAWLRDASLEWSRLAPSLSFSAEGYLRHVLHVEAGWEVVLCTWLPGQTTPVHGHDGSVGIVRVLAGVLTETRYRPGSELVARAPRPLAASRVVQEGRDVVHRMANEQRRPAVSLHLYCPPTR